MTEVVESMPEAIWPAVLDADGTEYPSDALAGALEFISKHVNSTGREKLFWDPLHCQDIGDGAKFMKMVSEIGEAYDALRCGNPASTKIPGYSHVEEELADVIILILDWSYQHGYDIGAAVITKALFNRTRPPLNGKLL